MSTEAYLIHEPTREAFHLGKFMGWWVDFDYSECDAEAFKLRMRRHYCELLQQPHAIDCDMDEDCTCPKGEFSTVEEMVDEADRVAALVFEFLVAHAWRVRVVERDWFFDNQISLAVNGRLLNVGYLVNVPFVQVGSRF